MPADPSLPSPDPPAEGFRWQGFFQRCHEPVFLLNGRRTLLFVNRAWEALTGVPLGEARGQVCRRRRDPRPDSLELLLNSLAPPPEALAGSPTRARRLIPGGAAGLRWWDVTFFPLRGTQGLLGILGRITAVAADVAAAMPLLPERLVAMRERIRQTYRLEVLDSELPAMRQVADQVRLASQTWAPVLLRGERGTGKEWIARTIHQESASRELAFAALDCGRLPPALLEAVLFGAAGPGRMGVGTLYLKEPQHLPRELQARLVDLLQSTTPATVPSAATPAPRILAGCRADPDEEVRAGRFLADLYFALSTLTISLPPLRERLAELPGLAERMLARLHVEDKRDVNRLSEEALDVLRSHLWPGNLQELHTVLAEACGRARGQQIGAGELPWYVRNLPPPPERTLPLDALLEQAERRLILLALRKARNNKTRAAEILAIWRPRLLRRMEALGIERDEGRGARGESEGEVEDQ